MSSRFFSIFSLILLLWASTTAEAVSLSEIFKQVRSSVVVIETKQTVNPSKNQKVAIEGLGSGVLISEKGLVMTAAHVIQTADLISVKFHDGKTVLAKVVSSEPAADVALLKLEEMPDKAVVAILGDSDAVEIGEEIFIVGSPYGMSHTLTVGHISARHKPYSLPGVMSLAEFFQTDAAVNKGNSGGPMFNMNGEVIGIVSYILSQSGGFEGLGFAATSRTAKEYLMERKSPWGGVSGYIISGGLSKLLNLPQNTGVLIQQVANNSPASRMGLRGGTVPAVIGGKKILLGGDIILGADGISLAEQGGYLKIKEHIGHLPANSKVTVKILRKGRQMELTANIP